MGSRDSFHPGKNRIIICTFSKTIKKVHLHLIDTHAGSLDFIIDISQFEVGSHKLNVIITDISPRTTTIDLMFIVPEALGEHNAQYCTLIF